jgi:hypothetical protein
VKCREFEEQITAAVDRYLRNEEKEIFDEHARLCPPCRREYETELSTKELVHSKARMAAVPLALYHSIIEQLERQSKWPWSVRAVSARFLQSPFVRPAIAFTLTAIVVLLVTRPAESPRGIPILTAAGFGPNNVVHQSVENFHRVLRGEITPQVVSSQSSEIQDFFSGKTEFPVRVPVMRQCTLVGAVVNQHKGAPLAHVVYRSGDDVIYLYQACWQTVQQGEKLDLALEVETELLRVGWYLSGGPGGDAIVLWKSGPTLCIAVSHMEGDHLLECLRQASIDSATAW